MGSRVNLEWVLKVHAERQGLPGSEDKAFYFPITQDFDTVQEEESSSESVEKTTSEADPSSSANTTTGAHTTPGGTPIWGAYAYWVSQDGYNALLQRLQRDVGAILWKGKRMRVYQVKPIDKVMPRQVIAAADTRTVVHVSRQPAFFRAPMLTSKIHAQWDPEFCKSTQFQLSHSHLTWQDLSLTELEQRIVAHEEANPGEWLTVTEMKERDEQNLVDAKTD